MSSRWGRPRCGGPKGKIIYETREEAREVLADFRRCNGDGRGSVKRCSWGEHYHITKGLRGKKGKGIGRS